MDMSYTLLIAALIAGAPATQPTLAKPAAADFAVSARYDTTHVYVPPEEYDAFMRSSVATFGGRFSARGQFHVTPAPSKTKSQLAVTPAGNVSAYGFLTPIPFAYERTGYLVNDIDAAGALAVRHSAVRLVATFPDPICHDAVVQWPGGVNVQLYLHTQKPTYAPLATVPENRTYFTTDAASALLKSWGGYAHAPFIADTKAADDRDIGEPGKTYRRVAPTSGYGKMLVIMSDGQLPWLYGHEVTGYEVVDLAGTLEKATAAGVEALVPAHDEGGRRSAMVRLPGGYIAEIQTSGRR